MNNNNNNIFIALNVCKDTMARQEIKYKNYKHISKYNTAIGLS
jgi:hypothetical protein